MATSQNYQLNVECSQTQCPHYSKCCKLPTSCFPQNDSIDLIIVGQGAGWQEERDHLPWIGKAGQLLRKVVKSVWEDKPVGIALANTVRCRPTDAQGKDRVPTQQELDFCMPYLQKDIDILKPYVVLLTGTSSTNAFGYKSGSISSMRGQVHTIGTDLVHMITYHPAGVLRNPDLGRKMRQDIERAIHMARPLHQEDPKLPF